MIYLIGIILALFLALILVSKKDKSQSDWVLFAWLLTIAINLILFTLHTTKTVYNYPFLLGWIFPMPLLHWSFLFIYISSLTTKSRLTAKYLIHFIPFIISLALYSNYFFLPGWVKIEIYENQGRGYETQMNINLAIIILSAIIYTALSIVKLWQYKKAIKNEFSYLEKINLNWLFYLTIGMTIIFLIIILDGTDKFIFTSVVGFVIFIGYFGIKQMGIFTQKSLFTENFQTSIANGYPAPTEAMSNFVSNVIGEMLPASDTEIELKKAKYQKSTLNEDTALKIYEDLNTIMRTEKLYKNAELKLDDLAYALKVLPNHLSQAINSIENRNFYDYINKLRIEEFIQLIALPENQRFTLLSLAFECGFNSKTSFNRNFKKVTGFTPSEYIKQKNIKMTA